MKTIQRGVLGEAIASAFGIKGGVAPSLDESIVGTYEPLTLEASPWRFPSGTGITLTRAALAGAFGYVGIKPPTTALLAVRGLIITNKTGGGLDYNVGFKRPAYTFLNEAEVAAAATDPVQGNVLTGARGYTATQVAGNITVITAIRLGASSSAQIWFPSPWVLGWPNSPWDAAIVQSPAVNTALTVGWFGDVYPRV